MVREGIGFLTGSLTDKTSLHKNARGQPGEGDGDVAMRDLIPKLR